MVITCINIVFLEFTLIQLRLIENVFEAPLLQFLCILLLIDIDECQHHHLCAHGQCRNTEGSFQCVCDQGYRASGLGDHCEGKNSSWFQNHKMARLEGNLGIFSALILWAQSLDFIVKTLGRCTVSSRGHTNNSKKGVESRFSLHCLELSFRLVPARGIKESV